MKRLIQSVFVVLVGANCSFADNSIATRLGELRDSWTFTSDQQPAANDMRQQLAGPITPVAGGKPTRFPRVNPQELLPRNWFGVGGKKTASAPTKPTPSTATDAGSARDRVLRDLKRIDSPRVAAAPSRAGSVLSPGATKVEPSPTTVAAQNAVLARSIAAEAAEATEAAEEATPDTTATNEDSPAKADTLTESEQATESLLPFSDTTESVVEADSPTETPVETEVAAETTPAETPLAEIEGSTPTESEQAKATDAESETTTGQLKVAARPTADARLPLFIGDRYSTIDEAKPVDTPEPVINPSTASAPAKAAFAAGPSNSQPSTRSIVVDPPISAQPKIAPEPVDEDLLFTQRMPVLVSKVSGPRTIVVGREATYRVLLANRGDVGADRVVTRITVPEGAEVVGARSADGTIEREDNSGEILWRASHLGASQILKLDLRLVARTGTPIELGVTHSHRPIDGRTLVEVQEPKLQLLLLGPDEVLYGKPQVFRLTLSNPGTGSAENVRLNLTPPGGDNLRTTSHDFGIIAAGEERTVEIELTAREAGELAVNASATADGNLTADVSKEVFCRKPELTVDWRGPADRYAGAPAVYYFRVRNPGTATAPDVVLDVDLPAGFEIAPTAQTPPIKNGRLAYRVGSLRPDEDRYFELRGVMRTAGANSITLRAAGSDETRSEVVNAVTEVIALADLKLDVLDPKGPVATGQEVAYEIRVTNRGSNTAHQVSVVGLFSDGIEPHHVDGGTCEMRDGRVAFETIDRMAAGEQRTFTIHARAHEEGTHLFRAEVLCRDLDIKLAAEETTRFFIDEPIDVADGYPSGRAGQVYPR